MKWLGLIGACLMTLPALAGEVNLSLDWNGIALDRPYPVTGGVPVERGALTDADAVSLHIEGRAVPVQAAALATWPDGSVKWLLPDFQARTDQRAATLRYADDAADAVSPAHDLVAEATEAGVEVDTGAVRFVVRADGGGFIDELSFNGHDMSAGDASRINVMDALHAASPDDYHPMDRNLDCATADPSRVSIERVSIEERGPLRAVVLIDGVYRFEHMGKTITGTDIKGDCPFRIRIHAYAGQSMLKVEHFFYYEGDGDHDFVRTLSLRTPLPTDANAIRFVDGQGEVGVPGPLAGLYQHSADGFDIWTSDGQALKNVGAGQRFEGVLDVEAPGGAIAVGVKDFWQNAAKSLHADLNNGELRINLWAPEAPPLDFRRQAREWSVGESGTPNDPEGTSPRAFSPDHQPNYRLASKGVGKTHYTMIFPHDPAMPDRELVNTYRLFNQRPLLWAEPAHYADSLALGRYRPYVPGEHEDLEAALNAPSDIWRFSREHFGWYGFWLYGNVLQAYNSFEYHGRWTRDFGRWGWANGDTVGRLGYALMLQAVRKCEREDFEFAESYIYNIHDVCSTHTPAYPHYFGNNFVYIKGAAHRHGAWPWAGTYVGVRGAHPMGAKIFYYLTGEGRAKDILDELAVLAVENPNGGAGDGPLGHNALMFIYRWETTGEDQWRERLKKEIEESELLQEAEGGWMIMMSAAFGIHNAMEEYAELTGDTSYNDLATDFADRAMPEKMRNHWTWGGYYRVYAHALNTSGDGKYRDALEEMLPVYVKKMKSTWSGQYPREQWPPPAGGPKVMIDANIIRDVPFALYALEQHREDQP